MDLISNTLILLIIVILSAILTIIFQKIFTIVGGNLYTSIRGGIPRAVGLAPLIVLMIFFPPPGNYLMGIIGIFAFFDDVIGRKNIRGLPFEIGQLSRGLGLLLVILVGYLYFGPVSILIGLMIQPMNIADMQPGKACSTIFIMVLLTSVCFYLITFNPFLTALILFAACLGYAPLDYQGKIMMGEVGNHSFGVGLGVLFVIISSIMASNYHMGISGTFVITLLFFIVTVIVIAFIRRNNLKPFLEYNLNISQPKFGDYFMDVLTGGGLGDLFRRIILRNKKIEVNNSILQLLGVRRLFYNPNAL
jgi:hypothetical protein